MIDAQTTERIEVEQRGDVAIVDVPISQLQRAVALIESAGVWHAVDPIPIRLDGRRDAGEVFVKGADVDAVQRALDDEP